MLQILSFPTQWNNLPTEAWNFYGFPYFCTSYRTFYVIDRKTNFFQPSNVMLWKRLVDDAGNCHRPQIFDPRPSESRK